MGRNSRTLVDDNHTVLPKAVVLLSGGLDSATTLAMARNDNCCCYALTINYGQRAQAELQAAKVVATALDAQEHRIIDLDLSFTQNISALTNEDIPLPNAISKGVPVSYVPARNTVLLSLALAWAESLGALRIYLGVNAIDYSGYPDCRPEYIEAFQGLANCATKTGIDGNPIKICVPLLQLDKASIIEKGMALGVDYATTVSCYQPLPEHLVCGRCESCLLRASAFASLGIIDPLLLHMTEKL